MIVVFGLLGIAVIAAVAVLLTRPQPLIEDDPVPGRPWTRPDPESLTPADLAGARFPVSLRGYSMSDVDQMLQAAGLALAAPNERAAAATAPGEPGLDPTQTNPDPALSPALIRLEASPDPAGEGAPAQA